MAALTNNQKETFVWLALGLSTIILRLAVRVKTRGFSGFYLDDYLIVLAGILFATESALAFTIGHYGTNNLTPEFRATLTPEMAAAMTYGSKLLYGGWYVYFSLLWTLKWCMISFYQRLTLRSKQATFLRYVSYIVAITPVAIVLTLIFNCWPVQKNWQVLPDPGVKCTQGWAYFGITGLPNVITEFLLLLVPLPLLFEVQMPLKRKIPLAFLLGLGIFIILATILRHVAIFRDIYDPRQVTIWATREAFTSIFVNCAAQLKPLYDWLYRRVAGTTISSSVHTDVEPGTTHSHSPSTVVLTEKHERRTSASSASTSNNSGAPGSSHLVINTKTCWAITTTDSQHDDLESGMGEARSDSQVSQHNHSASRTVTLKAKGTLPMYEVEVGSGN